MLRRQIVGMLADEGVLTSTFGVIYGLVLGRSLELGAGLRHQSAILQLEHRSRRAGWQLGAPEPGLIGAAAVTAVWSGRAALSQDAVRAVREDW